MLDRVREALFSTIATRLPDARVLDLFAGSGSLGLEALSRGARTARLVENDRRAAKILESNVEALGLARQVELVRADALDRASWGGPADIVFFDPPYAFLGDGRIRARLFEALQRLVGEVLAPEGVLVFHAPRRRVLPSELAGFAVLGERLYGTNALFYLGQREPLKEREESAP